MSRIFTICTLIITIGLVNISTLPVQQSDIDNTEDYPSDTHGGAVKAFSQLVSDDSGGSSTSYYRAADDDADTGDREEGHAEDGENSDLKLEGFDDSDDSETQYLIEEIYGYTYDEATDTDFNDKNSNSSKDSKLDDGDDDE